MSRRSMIILAGLAAGAAPSLAQDAVRSVRAVTTPQGTFLVESKGPRVRPVGHPLDAILWTDLEPISIPQSCGLSPFSNSAWVGEALNTERLQRFTLTGNGVPAGEFLGTHALFNPAAAAAAQNADLAVFMDQLAQDGPFKLIAFRSTDTTTPLWVGGPPPNFNNSGVHNLRVSRDGSVVAAAFWDLTGHTSVCYFYNANTGAEIGHWSGTDYIGGVDLTDNGSLAILQATQYARLIDTATGQEVWSTTGSGAGGWYNISGDGNVIVVGGFSFQVFKKSGAVYQPVINFNAPTSWFSWGSAVSRDGTTVGALTHDYGSNYLNTAVRVWDVASGALINTVTTTGTGAMQDAGVYGVMSDNGQVFAVASWGTENNDHPEVRVFNRNVELIESIDTPGSPFALDLSGDGQYVLAGSKSVHANTFGNGGRVQLLRHEGTHGCYANCDESTVAPILNINDFQCFVNLYAVEASAANCDGSTVAPVLNVNDFQCFVNKFAEGCG